MEGLISRSLDALRRAMQSSAVDRPAERGSPTPDTAEPVVYAVGDVHGMYDLMMAMLAAIEKDAQSLERAATVVFLGDVVNRGPETRRVIDRLIAGPWRSCDRWIVLRGNHEQAMLDALQTGAEAKFRAWLDKGGVQALQSYGAGRKDMKIAAARRLVGPRHLEFLESLPLSHIVGDRLFVHAGVEPGVPLEQQSAKNLMTIRAPFFARHHELPYTVVHGHTPIGRKPRLGPGRIGLDTGAYTTGVLSAGAFAPETDRVRFLRVSQQRPRKIV